MSKKSKRQNVPTQAPVVSSELPAAADTTVTETVAPAPADTQPPEVVPASPDTQLAAPAEVAPASAPALKYPREGGKCWAVWNAADTLVAEGQHPTVATLRAIAVERNWNVSNASQEFYRWRKYRGRK